MKEIIDIIVDNGYLLYLVLGLVMVPGVLLAAFASRKVSSTFSKYSSVHAGTGYTGASMARSMLDRNGLREVQIYRVSGTLTDYYHPTKKQLALSDSTILSSSVAALGVAAHECGHAVQHKKNYIPAKLRGLLVPVINLTSKLSWPLVVIALSIGFVDPELVIGGFPLGKIMVIGGIAFFGGTMLFALVTLPTEFDASRRAYKMLVGMGILTVDEAKQAKKVLNAAAMTYVASLVSAILGLVRFLLYIFISTRRNKNR